MQKNTNNKYLNKGTVRVPAPVQYAHKLAYMVGESLKAKPHAELERELFYL